MAFSKEVRVRKGGTPSPSTITGRSLTATQLQVTGQRPNGADIVVQTRIVKSNGEATRLDYLMLRTTNRQ
jgi:hypothetical protein